MTSSNHSISRRKFVTMATGAAIAAPFINLGKFQLYAGDATRYSDRAIRLVTGSLVMDMLSLFDMTRLFSAMSTGDDPLKFTHDELVAIKASGIDVFHPATGMGGPSVQLDVMNHMAAYNGLVAEHPDMLMRVDSVADIELVSATGKIGIILGI